MRIKLLINMNLWPQWVMVFERNGWESVHWSTVGNPCATDQVIMQWARKNGYVIFTHDLDFGRLLAITYAEGPSVIQVRTQDVLPDPLGNIIITILQQYSDLLEKGALIVVDENKLRVRILPLLS